MPDKIFVNLPVKDLDASMAFFKKIGFSFNPQFTDATAACMVISDSIFAMLLTHEKFAGFTPKPVADAHKSTEVLLALSYDSREKVVETIATALANGGTRYAEAKDHGFMLQDGFADLDGHIWEIFYMDPSFVQ